jgi:hypothetical protein
MTAASTPNGRVAALGSDHQVLDHEEPGRYMTLKRAAMAGATAFLTVNIWTGAPLLSLWVGSQAVGGTLSFAAVCLVVVVLAALAFALAVALTRLNDIYDELTGRTRTERRATWLRSMRDEAGGDTSQREGATLLERIVVINVYLAVIALVAWYVFFAAAPSPVMCFTGTQC